MYFCRVRGEFASVVDFETDPRALRNRADLSPISSEENFENCTATNYPEPLYDKSTHENERSVFKPGKNYSRSKLKHPNEDQRKSYFYNSGRNDNANRYSWKEQDTRRRSHNIENRDIIRLSHKRAEINARPSGKSTGERSSSPGKSRERRSRSRDRRRARRSRSRDRRRARRIRSRDRSRKRRNSPRGKSSKRRSRSRSRSPRDMRNASRGRSREVNLVTSFIRAQKAEDSSVHHVFLHISLNSKEKDKHQMVEQEFPRNNALPPIESHKDKICCHKNNCCFNSSKNATTKKQAYCAKSSNNESSTFQGCCSKSEKITKIKECKSTSTPKTISSVSDDNKILKGILERLKSCKICKKMFSTRRGASSHLLKIHDKRVCPVCFEPFPTKGNTLKEHFITEHTNNDADEKAPCPICKKKITFDRMKQHLSTFHVKQIEGATSKTTKIFSTIGNPKKVLST